MLGSVQKKFYLFCFMKKGITIKDIARKLNMSVSTVSKALNNNPSISVLTKERVQKLAKEWNYIPNEAARHFKQNKSFTIGVIMPDLLDQFYVLAINGVEEVANKKNYNVIISQTHEDHEKETGIVENMIRNRVDGVIIAISKNTRDVNMFKRLMHTGIPVVFFSRAFSEPEFDFVATDNEGGSFTAVKFLIDKGHTRIAHLMGPSFLRTTHQRLEGYKKALEKYGLTYDPELVVEVDLSPPQTYKATKKLMELNDPPTAFFTFKNYVSLDVIKYLKKHHRELLDKTDIIGFGNLPLIKYLDYKPIASIDENSYEMGIEAANMIFKKIEMGGDATAGEGAHIKVPSKLVKNI